MSDNYDPANDPIVQELLELAELFERGEISEQEYEKRRNAIESKVVVQSDNAPKDSDPDGDS